ncbi:MAG: MerR family transcriptional regulator [Pseudomonadota bacterium]
MANPQPVPLPTGPSGGKSPEAFRTISEAAAELDLPQHVLRFWETRFATIRPLKRSGGRRYYRPEDVTLLRRIRDLLREKGYTIKGVQKLLRQGGEPMAAIGGAAEAPIVLDPLAAASESSRRSFNGGGDSPAAGPEAADASTAADLAAPAEAGFAKAGSAASATGGGEASLLSPAAREELEAVLAELEALRALVKAG